MDEIRVDQSHCNYYLAQYLKNTHWDILFLDPGRVSRGGAGTQGECLRVFEVFSLHIPDIVASKNANLLLIEIDASFNKAVKSLASYKVNQDRLLGELTKRITPVESLKTGFCYTGIKTPSKNRSLDEFSDYIDLRIIFEQPRVPTLQWITKESF